MAISRRVFLAAPAAFSIVPRSVLGGVGYVPPSDRITAACIGVGSQGFRVMTEFLPNADLQVVAVCDVNQGGATYEEWGQNELRDKARKLLGDANWGGNGEYKGGIAGLAPARDVVEKYYGKNRPSGSYKGCATYADFRELIAKEKNIDAVIIGTPDHLHAPVSMAAMRARKHVFCQKPMTHSILEARKLAETARETGVATQVAIGNSSSESTRLLCEWVWSGAIGPVRRVHNWSSRPFWPQGMQAYHASGPAGPAGFNWELWQGPEPERPYHPSYTFAVYRGWYAYGTGCLGDMGHYSLWQPYRILKLGVPVSVEARCSAETSVDEHHVSEGGHISPVAFPKASVVRWRHAAIADRPAVDTFWYDGGMKPQTPDELYEDNEDLADEGMLFVGDKGKILCDFEGNKPRLIPKSRHRAFEANGVGHDTDMVFTSPDDEWVTAIKKGTKSRGSFEEVAPLSEAVTLAAIALRVPYKRLLWDAQQMAFTNSEEANKLVRREYRPGWESMFA